MTRPELFVLKPQLEGGGGNYYGTEVAEMLGKFEADERAAHILMERIYPVPIKVGILLSFCGNLGCGENK